MENHKKQLAVFTRYPLPGNTKTRLAPALGFQGAADLQKKMTEHIICFLKQLKEDFDLAVEVRYEGGNADLIKRWLGDGFTYRPQGTGDLGFRMKGFFQDAFANGSDMAVIVGSDIPEITDAVIKNAFDILCRCDMVLGPAKDGGYYLIGMRRDWLSKTFHHSNPYSDRVKMIVIESGKEALNTWITEERNIYKDYVEAFGVEPPMMSGIAIMTDSDNTKESATAFYGDILLKKK